MNGDRVGKKMETTGGKNLSYWKNKLNNELVTIVGKYEQFAEIFQRKYGVVKEEVKQQVDAFKTIIEQLKNPAGS